MDLEQLRRSGISTGPLRWITNPARSLLFRLALPYFEVIARWIAAREPAPAAPPPSPPPVDVEAITAEVQRLALEQAGAQLRRELDGARAETRAMGSRFASIEDMLQETSRWLGESDRQQRALAAQLATALDGIGQRIATVERLAASKGEHTGVTAPSDGSGFVLTHGPYGTFLVRHPDVVGDAIIRGEFWDDYLEAAIRTHADPSRTAIDAGAYIGFHTVFLARHFAHVQAFEPEPHAYALLRANIALNGCRNAVAHECGLYSHPCRLELAPDAAQEVPLQRDDAGLIYGAIGNPAALAFVEAAGGGSTLAVTIDSFGLDRVGFIKIDTQGADLAVLRGAAETIRRCRPVIAFEFERELSHLHGDEWEMFEAFFRDQGYRIEQARRTPDGKQTDYLALPA